VAAPAEEATRVLLVEGSDDEHVIRHLCDRAGLPSNFSTVSKDGIDALLKSVPSCDNRGRCPWVEGIGGSPVG